MEREGGIVGNTVERYDEMRMWKLEGEGGRWMEVQKSSEQEIGKLYEDRKQEMEWLEVERLGGEL